jgi:hypothetical protein
VDIVTAVDEMGNANDIRAHRVGNQLIIHNPNPFFGGAQLKIFSITGQLLWEMDMNQSIIQVNMPLPAAWYILRLEDENGVHSIKALKLI